MGLQDTIKHYVLSSFLSLPLLILGFLGFMSVGLGNLGLFILFVGHITLLPLVVSILHFVFNAFGERSDLFTKPLTDVTKLVPSATTRGGLENVSVMPSWWMSHFVFFMGYMFWNILDIRTTLPAPGSDQWKVNNRNARTTSILIGIVVATVALTILRYVVTGAETLPGIIGAFAVILPLSYGWYEFATVQGARNADIFGVVQQMLSPNARQPPPMMCTYTAPASS